MYSLKDLSNLIKSRSNRRPLIHGKIANVVNKYRENNYSKEDENEKVEKAIVADLLKIIEESSEPSQRELVLKDVVVVVCNSENFQIMLK